MSIPENMDTGQMPNLYWNARVPLDRVLPLRSFCSAMKITPKLGYILRSSDGSRHVVKTDASRCIYTKQGASLLGKARLLTSTPSSTVKSPVVYAGFLWSRSFTSRRNALYRDSSRDSVGLGLHGLCRKDVLDRQLG